MYKVFFENQSISTEMFRSPDLEQALAYALSIHRASNVSHSVSVYDPMKDDDCITLVRK